MKSQWKKFCYFSRSANFVCFYLDETMFIARLIPVISGICDSDEAHNVRCDVRMNISKLLSLEND